MCYNRSGSSAFITATQKLNTWTRRQRERGWEGGVGGGQKRIERNTEREEVEREEKDDRRWENKIQ